MRPILFHIGSFPIHSFGVLVGLGFVLGLWWASRRAASIGIFPDHILDLGPWLLGGGLIGARLLYVISYWQRDFADAPFSDIFKIWNGGLVFYGGLIGATLLGIFRVRRLKLPVWRVADCLAPSVALGHVFGRLGCFMNGCCFGLPFQGAWAVKFPIDRVPHGQPVHPTQLYEAVLNLALALTLDRLFVKRRFDGQIFALYLAAYAIVRTLTELFRGDYSQVSTPTAGIFTPGQAASAWIFAAGVALWFWLRKHPIPPTPGTSEKAPP